LFFLTPLLNLKTPYFFLKNYHNSFLIIFLAFCLSINELYFKMGRSITTIWFRRNQHANTAVLAWVHNQFHTFVQSETFSNEVDTTLRLCTTAGHGQVYDLLLMHEAFCQGDTTTTTLQPTENDLPPLYNLAVQGAAAVLHNVCVYQALNARQKYLHATLVSNDPDVGSLRIVSGRLPVDQPVAAQLQCLGIAEADVVALTPGCASDIDEIRLLMGGAGFHMASAYADTWEIDPSTGVDGGLWVRWTLADLVRFEQGHNGLDYLTIGGCADTSSANTVTNESYIAETSF
jgi:hypothetical protein